jgi:hypothetical protein
MCCTHSGVFGDGLVIAEVEKRDERTILQPEEEVRVGAVFAGAGHVIALDDVVQRQAQDVFVEVACFLGVPRAVSDVVQLVDRHGSGDGDVLQNSGHDISFNLPMRNAFTVP